MEVRFTVLGIPKAKGRPRVSMVNGFARAYTPKDTIMYENLVRYAYQSDVGTKMTGCIKADIKAYFPIPKSVSKKKRQEMETEKTYYDKKPDSDNLGKTILDSINGIAYDDDKQIIDMRVRKYYGTPRVEVVLTEQEDTDGEG